MKKKSLAYYLGYILGFIFFVCMGVIAIATTIKYVLWAF